MNSLHTGSTEGVKEREAFWDNAKFFLIVLVVVGHFLEPYRDIDYFWPRYLFTVIYTFHMPLFIFISGLFSKTVIRGERFRFERVISFLLLYMINKIIGALLDHFLWGDAIKIDFFVVQGLAWYLLAMAAWLFITYLVKDIHPLLVMGISIALAFLVGFSTGNGDTVAFFRVINYWPFFLLGFYLDRDKILRILNLRWLRVCGVIGFLLFLFLTWRYIDDYWTYIRLFTGRNNYEAIAGLWEGFHAWYRLIYYAFVIVIGFCVFSIVPRRRINPFSKWGSRTLQVYFIHIFVKEIFTFLGLYTVITTVISTEKYWTFVLIVIAFALTAVLSLKIWNRPFRWIMNQSFTALFRKQN